MKKLIAAIDLGTTKIVCIVGEKTPQGTKIIGVKQNAPWETDSEAYFEYKRTGILPRIKHGY